MRLLILSISILAVNAFPQDSTSAKDVLDSADSARYGDDVGAVDQSVLDDVFGTNQDVKEAGAPQGYIEDDEFDNCTFYKDYGFECVPYYQCQGGYIITDGAGLFDIRNGFNDVLDPENSKCESYLEVCCRDENYSDVPLPKKPVTTTTTTTVKPTTARPQSYQRRCGRRNTGGVGVRIQNDQYSGSTQFGEWPHMCAVLRKGEVSGNEVNLYVCGASLIAPGVVMTAAHCVKDFNDDPSVLKVRCGEWDTQQTIEPRRHEDRAAYKVSMHPLFNPTNLQNDFALIHLDTEFDLQPHIDTICLPEQNSYNEDFFDQDCFATGWGKDKFGKEGQYQVILKQVRMDVVDSNQCQDILRGTRLGKRFRLDESFLCAGGVKDQDTCKGDGGGPLVCPRYKDVHPDDQQYVQNGIVAWGLGCGEELPGVYAKVSESLCFIDWATKCVHGQNADFYGYSGCQRWGKRQYCQFKDDLYDEERKARPNRLRLGKLNDYISKFEKAVKDCSTGADYQADIDCNHYDYLVDSDAIDISSNARKGEKLSSAAAKSNVEDDSSEEEANHQEEEEEDDPRSASIDSK